MKVSIYRSVRLTDGTELDAEVRGSVYAYDAPDARPGDYEVDDLAAYAEEDGEDVTDRLDPARIESLREDLAIRGEESARDARLDAADAANDRARDEAVSP